MYKGIRTPLTIVRHLSVLPANARTLEGSVAASVYEAHFVPGQAIDPAILAEISASPLAIWHALGSLSWSRGLFGKPHFFHP
jgi:hypothetical protein